jgi:hypothetical protein
MRTDGWVVCKASAGNKNLRRFIHAYVIYDCIHVWWYVYAWLRCVHVSVGFENTNYMFACSSLICTCVNMHAYVCRVFKVHQRRLQRRDFYSCVRACDRPRANVCMHGCSVFKASAGVCVYDCICMYVNVCTHGLGTCKSRGRRLQRRGSLCGRVRLWLYMCMTLLSDLHKILQFLKATQSLGAQSNRGSMTVVHHNLIQLLHFSLHAWQDWLCFVWGT